MITNEQINKYLSSLKSHTENQVRENQKWHIPFVITNTPFEYEPTTFPESIEYNDYNRKYANIVVKDKYRYNGKWFYYRYSVNKPEETFGILEVDNLPYRSFSNRINKKSFIGRLDRLVYQGMIEPFMLFINDKFVKWDDINIVYDSDESWILLSGEKYNYWNLLKAHIDIVVTPFKCDYIGEEDEYLFNLNYNALCAYLQDNAVIKNGDLLISVPTLDTEYEYNHMMFNIGAWMYAQIKKNFLNQLSDTRSKKLRYITIYKNVTNDNGDIIESSSTRFNALDKDSYTSKALFNSLCYMGIDKYNDYPCLSFTYDGELDTESGEYKFYIIDDNTIVSINEDNKDLIMTNMSSINNILFRENYLVFKNGLFNETAPLMTSINNITLYDNPALDKISVITIYNKNSAHVIRNSDLFMKSYMNEKAVIYLEYLYYHKYEPENDLDAHAINSEKIFRDIFAEYDTEHVFAFEPSLTDYIVFLNDKHTYEYDIVNQAKDSLDYNFSINKTFEQNVNDALDAVIDYDPSLLNPLYHTYVDSQVFNGAQANESLLYQFMYERKRGLKIPRKKYRDHETYAMVFLNGELYENYYKTIAYANFFFIPVDEGFEFSVDDRIEILYFKYINNNEIRFHLSDWLLRSLKDNEEDMNFFNMELFKPFIPSEDLNIFSHYPKSMLYYPTLIKEASEEIAFNISYRDSNNNLCVKKNALQSIINEAISGGSNEPIVRDPTIDIAEIEQDGSLTDIGITNTELSMIDMETGDTYAGSLAFLQSNLSDYFDIISNNIIVSEIGVNINNMLSSKDKDYEYLKSTLVASSKHKFVYERLYVDQKSYRIRMDRRFRYCDNQRQYMLFINGRCMKQDSFLVTIPKHTRPFTGIYLYTCRFVNPEDRIEIFYLPYEMNDLNIDNNPRAELHENGYLDYDRKDIDVPLSKDLYLFFINGKKIPITDISDIDTHTIRININTNTLKYPSVTSIAIDAIPKVSEYLHDEFRLSKRDKIINYVKTRLTHPYDELDNMFGKYVTMTDGEPNMVWANVARIAILNEIVRDFWVTSGYNYNNQLFVYDYEQDELYEKDENDNLILPAMDANPEINIKKNEVGLSLFYSDPADLIFEIGDDATKNIKFFWEYTQRFNQDLKVVSQSFNGVELPTDAREYEITDTFTQDTKFKFAASTGQDAFTKEADFSVVNGVYWGNIDEDQLQYYKMKNAVVRMDDLLAVIPKYRKPIPSSIEQEKESGNFALQEHIQDNNTIISGITYDKENAVIWTKDDEMWTLRFYKDDFYAICEDGRELHNITYQLNNHVNDNPGLIYENLGDIVDEDGTIVKKPMNLIREYYDEGDLHELIPHLDKHLVRYSDIDIKDYIMGNNNYFVFACPKNITKSVHTIDFLFTDLKDEDLINHCMDDKTTPIYTNGKFTLDTKELIKLDKMSMEYMGEFDFTNQYGYTERYVAWKTNGYFTRLFENYGIDISIKIGEIENVEYTLYEYRGYNILQESDDRFMTRNVPITDATPAPRSIEEANRQIAKTNTADTGVSIMNTPKKTKPSMSVREQLDKGIFII